MAKLRSVQVLRGVAACAVVAHHAYGHSVSFDTPVRLGAAGVDLFFVISGFIMATVASGKTPGGFLSDRAWRIFPMWFVAVAPWLLLRPNDLPTIAASLTLWPVYGGGFYQPALALGWTLSFEMLFYCGFALALATRASVPLLVFAACLILGLSTGSALLQFVGSPLGLEFLLGVMIARLPPDAKAGVVMLLFGAFALALSPLQYSNQAFGIAALLRVAVWGLPAAAILYGVRSMEGVFGRPAFDFPVLIGGASYSIYLFHLTALWLAPWLHWTAQIGVAVMAGIAMFRFVEAPMLHLRRRPRLPAYGLTTTIP